MRSTEGFPGARRGCGVAPGSRSESRRAGAGIASLLGLALGVACASSPAPAPSWEFFAPATPDLDAWYSKVVEWQTRAQADRVAPLPPAPEKESPRRRPWEALTRETGLDPLPEKLSAFASTERRILAERIFDWTRRTAGFYYQSDLPEEEESPDGRYVAEDPADDYWPTFSELIVQNGDDCDGLDLVAYRILQEFGFPRDQLFRAIVRRDSNRANHMVTLWFEDPSDPWVFDATGAMTMEFRRFSETSGWTPTAIFNENEQYVVRRREPQLGRAAQMRGAALD